MYRKASFLLIVILGINFQLKSQIVGSEVYGTSPIMPDKTNGNMVDENWGLLPSMQGNNVDMWGRTILQYNPVNEPAFQDSTELTGTTSVDFDDEPPPPPDDPLDIPLDGGTSILIAIAAGLEYKRRAIKKPTK